ncbi:squamous cell carcinoma antigen recognized by T-cells 3, partial [Morus notabilis]|uniref:squamous cell carcinoma antigen recognized by T-cells 3 n=1 Tax=Morus notabilis TaxID=981085 RepID=UPI000CECE3E1
STSLWSDYLAFIQEYDPSVRECSPAGISKARDLFERALTATGLHVAEGNKIWEAYREFEQAILHAIDEADIQAIEKQVQRIRSIFHRQLAVPLVNMRSTLLVYKAWEAEQGSILNIESDSLDGVSSHVASAYQKALDVYNARVHLEEKISRQDIPDLERLQEFMNYVKFEQSSGDPARVQILFDRAITEFPVSSDLWLDYTRYLDRTLKVGSAVTNVHSRAIKNCPWVGELWVRYLLSLERNRASEKEIFAVFEKALRCTFSTLDE